MWSKTVKATREGLLGGRTASGYIVDPFVPFVALPSTIALGRAVRVTNPLNNLSVDTLVLDVGPWNSDDHEYVFGMARPQAESGRDKQGRITNLAGMDLSEAVWKVLGMKDNTDVVWEFL